MFVKHKICIVKGHIWVDINCKAHCRHHYYRLAPYTYKVYIKRIPFHALSAASNHIGSSCACRSGQSRFE